MFPSAFVDLLFAKEKKQVILQTIKIVPYVAAIKAKGKRVGPYNSSQFCGTHSRKKDRDGLRALHPCSTHFIQRSRTGVVVVFRNYEQNKEFIVLKTVFQELVDILSERNTISRIRGAEDIFIRKADFAKQVNK